MKIGGEIHSRAIAPLVMPKASRVFQFVFIDDLAQKNIMPVQAGIQIFRNYLKRHAYAL